MTKIHIEASRASEAQAAAEIMVKKYKTVAANQADVIIALGGDGFMLSMLHKYMDLKRPIFGINRGTMGFLMNDYNDNNIIDRIQNAETIDIHPLRMKAIDVDRNHHEYLAINEVSLLRESRQNAHIQIKVDGKIRMKELAADGILVSTAAGSTAYNMSVYGPIIPLGSNLLALTPISACRPSRWRGALLPHTATIELKLRDHKKRPVSAVADMHEVRNILEVEIQEAKDVTLTLMFDQERNLAERIFNQQFNP